MRIMNRRLKLIVVPLAALLLTHSAYASRSCESKPLDATRIAKGLTLAERTHTALNASAAKLGLLARAGSV